MRLSPSRLALGVALAGAMLSFPAHAQQTKASLSNYNYYYVYANGRGYVTGPIMEADVAGVINSMCGLALASDCVLPAGVAAANLGAPIGTSGATIPLNNAANTESGIWTFSAGVQLTPIAYASLPTCNSGAQGELFAVTDSNSATFNATMAGSGTNHVMAFCNGTNWTVH